MEVEASIKKLTQMSRQKETTKMSLRFFGHYNGNISSITFTEMIVIQRGEGAWSSKYYPILHTSPCRRYDHGLLANPVIFW